MTHSAVAAARFIAEAHRVRAPYQNLPGDLAPANVDEAYATQEALADFWTPEKGRIAGLKIATTTKIMQALMGIDHPCGGMIYESQIHQSPMTLDKSKYMHVVIECELAVRLGRDLPKTDIPYDRKSVREAIGSVMPAFELIEDRNAVYKECKAMTLIADNAWNAGIVLGREVPLPPSLELDGLAGALEINGVVKHEGKTDDPLGALAWVANLAVSRGRPMRAGMVVITGSVVTTLPIADGETFRFTLAGLGSTEMTAPSLK